MTLPALEGWLGHILTWFARGARDIYCWATAWPQHGAHVLPEQRDKGCSPCPSQGHLHPFPLFLPQIPSGIPEAAEEESQLTRNYGEVTLSPYKLLIFIT